MSRIGKKPIELPAKVSVKIGADGAVNVEGPKGKLAWNQLFTSRDSPS